MRGEGKGEWEGRGGEGRVRGEGKGGERGGEGRVRGEGKEVSCSVRCSNVVHSHQVHRGR